MVIAPDAQPLSMAEIAKVVDAPLWALIDGVSCPELEEMMVEGVEALCLYRADTVQEAPYAPWLLKVEQGSTILDDLGVLSGDMHWGFVFSADATLNALRTHFRKFTMLWTPAQQTAPVYFRFYDPRVLSDALMSLEPGNIARLMKPVSQVFVPVSPLLGGWTGLSPLAEKPVYRGHLLELALPDHADDVGAGGAFRVNDAEYAQMSKLHATRSRRKLARDLRQKFRQAPDEVILKAAEIAPEAAAEYGLVSVKQVMIYASAIVRHGVDFDTKNAEARVILNMPTLHSWKISDQLKEWTDSTGAFATAGTSGAEAQL